MAWKARVGKSKRYVDAEWKSGTPHVDWYTSIFELIDLRSFSNLWFWIALAVVWSSASHWVIGVPYDMVLRARRKGGQAQIDLEDLARIYVNRLLYLGHMSGIWLLGFACFVFSGLAMLGFWYDMEFAQAVLMLLFPMTLVGVLSFRLACRIDRDAVRGEDLRKLLSRQRSIIQFIGMISIFLTALWGMYQNLTIGVLGG